jgi:hypothetical protein
MAFIEYTKNPKEPLYSVVGDHREKSIYRVFGT